jgi:hypothetical protein
MAGMRPSPRNEAFGQSNNGGWRRSSASGTSGACVEVARVADGGLAVRDSKNPEGGRLAFSAVAWQLFTGILRG